MSIDDDDLNIWSLWRHGSLGEELPEGYEVLAENFTAPQQCCDQIPSLISSVRDLVNALSSNTQTTAAIPETFGVREAAARLGCSPGQVRRLVHDGRLGHHWIGKNLQFRQADLGDFWASQTRCGADKMSSRALSGGRDRKRSETKRRDTKASSLPTRREVEKLWR